VGRTTFWRTGAAAGLDALPHLGHGAPNPRLISAKGVRESDACIDSGFAMLRGDYDAN
jgi:hypothetical protein